MVCSFYTTKSILITLNKPMWDLHNKGQIHSKEAKQKRPFRLAVATFTLFWVLLFLLSKLPYFIEQFTFATDFHRLS